MEKENVCSEEKFVWPWVGLVANIPTEAEPSGRRVGKSGSSFPDELIQKGFNPTRVQPIWNFNGHHTGFALVEFSKDFEGFGNAMRFERSYNSDRHGKQDWENGAHLRDEKPYGWVAREDDYNESGIVGENVRKNRDLKSVAQIQEEDERKMRQLVQHMSQSIEMNLISMQELELKVDESSPVLESLELHNFQINQNYREEIEIIEVTDEYGTNEAINDYEVTEVSDESEINVVITEVSDGESEINTARDEYEITVVNEESEINEVGDEFEITEVSDEPEITEVVDSETTCPCKYNYDAVIFRVPPRLFQYSPEAFKPSMVSIGPYYYKDTSLQRMEQKKPMFVKAYLHEANKHGVSLASLKKDFGDMEETIRSAYSEYLPLSKDELVDLMIRDGCFLLLVTLKGKGFGKDYGLDPVPWSMSAVRRDTILLENQLPYEVIRMLFARLNHDSSLLPRKIMDFYHPASAHTNLLKWQTDRERRPDHLVDLFLHTLADPLRMFFGGDFWKVDLILSAKQLQLQGIKFKVEKNPYSLLHVRLENKNELVIPQIELNKFMTTLMLNCVALEQNAPWGTRNDMTTYFFFMGLLMKDEKDAALICNKGIVENHFGTNEEAANFFKDVSKEVEINLGATYMGGVVIGLDAYTSSRRYRRYRAELERYMDSPVTIASTVAGFFLICIGIVQVALAAVSYKHDLKNPR